MTRWARSRTALAAGIGLVWLAGCTGSSNRMSSSRAAVGAVGTVGVGGLKAAGTANPAAVAPAGGGSSVGLAVSPGQARIVRTGDIQLAVTKGRIPLAFDQVSGLVTANGGFIADSNLSTGGPASGRLVLRVPADHLDGLIKELAKVGTVNQETLKGEDVTGQLVDLAARIRTLQAEEDAVRTLLGRAQEIGQILQIQSQLFDLRTQIEQLDAQRSQLDNQASFATLSVEFTEGGPAMVARPAHQPTLEHAWQLATDNSVSALQAVALTLGWAFPALVVAGMVGLAYAIIRRRVRRRPDEALT
jgi:hypothetical protein